jgi:putative transposase
VRREEYAVNEISAELLSPQAHFHDLETLLRSRVRELIATILDEEVTAALGAGPHDRDAERQGYRHGHRPARKLVTSLGPVAIEVPRARLRTEAGTEEFQSRIVSRYERRTRRVDAALLSCYLAGANSRKVKLALKPLVEGTAVSRSSVSRLVKRLQGLFTAWRGRDLGSERYRFLIADAIYLGVRLARRVVKVPVQTVIGVNESGEKVLLDLRIAPSESLKAWEGMMEGLAARNLVAPDLVVMDGNRGLVGAVRRLWPQAKIQRCTNHKWENLKAKAPKHCHDELKRDYRALTHAEDGDAARRATAAFVAKWRREVPEVARSLEEAGEELLTFYAYPDAMWKSLRTSNLIERLNGEFRRRTTTQGSFPTEESALVLLFGLVASGTIQMRKIDGYYRMHEVAEKRAA